MRTRSFFHPAFYTSILACAVLSGVFAAALPARPVQARFTSDPTVLGRDMSAQIFARQSSTIGALRGLSAERYVHQFSKLARQQRLDQTGKQVNGPIVLVDNWTIT